MKLLFRIALLILISATTHSFAQDSTDTTHVVILTTKEDVPAGSKLLGKIRISDGGFKTRCGYYEIMDEARDKAIDMGGNVVKLTEIIGPDVWSSCYRMRADIYSIPGIPDHTSWAKIPDLHPHSVKQRKMDTSHIEILTEEETVPTEAKLLGTIKVSDNGFRGEHSYYETMDDARDKAREMGGNVVKITELKEPDAWSVRYRIRAEVYSCPGIGKHTLWDIASDSIIHSLLPDTASYALLYVYRPRGGSGPIIQYQLHVDDSAIGPVSTNSAYIVKLTKRGRTKVWARTESRSEVVIDAKPGHLYFVKCGIKMGILIGEPDLRPVDIATGLPEFNTIMKRHNKD